METNYLLRAILGLLFLIGGIFLTFKPKLTYEKESASDIIAVAGIILMVLGVILLLSPFLK